MMRSLVVLSIFTFMAGCGEAREPVDVTVDTFNVALAGAFIPFEAARRPYISEAIAASDAGNRSSNLRGDATPIPAKFDVLP